MNIPTQMDGDMMVDANTSGMGQALGFQKSVTSMDGMNRYVYQDGLAAHNLREDSWGMMNQGGGGGGAIYSGYEGRDSAVGFGGGGIFDGMALPDMFLKQYYTQVRNLTNLRL